MRFRYQIVLATLLLVLIGFMAQMGLAQGQSPPNTPRQQPTSILFENVRIFDGTSEKLSAPSNVLVVGNKIQTISTASIPTPAEGNVTRINGKGRVLMPGLIDAHTHLFMETTEVDDLMALAASGSPELAFRQLEKNATAMLMRGFTSVRDMAGPVFELKKAIDTGKVVGPRIWPSGAMISQTGGHGDFRKLEELPRTPTSKLSLAEQYGVGAIADGVDEVLRRTREQLMRGASQIKLAAGGGVASSYDPIDVSQYTEAEFKAAVDAAANWNTYVAVHAYTPTAIQTAIRAGVKSIEHGQLMDEKTAKLMADKGIWLSIQPFLDDEDANPYPQGSANRARQLQVSQGTDTAYKLAKKYNLKTAWGTDTLYSAKKAARQGAQLAKMVRWYTPAEVLRMATSTNAELLALSGPRNPYPGKLGVVEEGALADLLLVNGNPLENIKLIENPAKNFIAIVKDGKVYKNLLS
ncbi:MAG: amidohydrolase family protein [Chlorogloeopsis fritschii C42_A2020_084]|uniref:metal-dependent hydrolase family protein n=1 Tax=Chlorogloeopsis fritschii TaxID=1124 RepID=UPI0019E6753D|nr:amidohydrolase family protein [Chlorogloeopsis fritschii]MBF2008340.1 amidohydrolase family protein [Chlorogloeopsis fritschii C42_A2020_084]